MTSTKKKLHFLDLKIPLGCLLTFYGLVLTIYGIFTDPSIYRKSLGIDVNIWWGLLMLVIGVFLLGLVISGRQKNK